MASRAAPTSLRFTLLILAIVLASCSSRAATPEARYLPAGDLLDIVKDFQRLAKEDTYRFAIPKDVTGINIMVQGRPGGFSVYPRIQTSVDKSSDPELYR